MDDPSGPRRPPRTVRTQMAIAVVFIAIFVAAGLVFGAEHQWVLMTLFLAAAAVNGWVMSRSLIGGRRG